MLGLVVLTPVILVFITTNSYRGEAARHSLLIADAAIALRAIVGIIQRKHSRAWLLYAGLYPILIIVAAVLAWVFAPDSPGAPH